MDKYDFNHLIQKMFNLANYDTTHFQISTQINLDTGEPIIVIDNKEHAIFSYCKSSSVSFRPSEYEVYSYFFKPETFKKTSFNDWLRYEDDEEITEQEFLEKYKMFYNHNKLLSY